MSVFVNTLYFLFDLLCIPMACEYTHTPNTNDEFCLVDLSVHEVVQRVVQYELLEGNTEIEVMIETLRRFCRQTGVRLTRHNAPTIVVLCAMYTAKMLHDSPHNNSSFAYVVGVCVSRLSALERAFLARAGYYIRIEEPRQ